MKLEKLKDLHRENKKLDLRKTYVFSLFKSVRIQWGKNCFQDNIPYF